MKIARQNYVGLLLLLVAVGMLPGCAWGPEQYTKTNFDPLTEAQNKRTAPPATKLSLSEAVDSYGHGSQNNSTTPATSSLSNPTKPMDTTVKTSEKMLATLHTEQGDIVIELSDKTPKTSGNFMELAKNKFYDGTIFHRVIKGFMIQGGDPRGDGTGGPGYTFADEPFTGSYTRGTVAMANAGPNTNGSQFFIMHADYPLPPNYVIFGRVVKGMEAVDKIATAPVKAGRSGEGSTPVTPVVVKTVTIEKK